MATNPTKASLMDLLMTHELYNPERTLCFAPQLNELWQRNRTAIMACPFFCYETLQRTQHRRSEEYILSRTLMYRRFKASGLDPAAISITRNEAGKPRFWHRNRTEVHANLSHSGNAYAFTLGPMPLGIDVELYDHLAKKVDILVIAKKHYTSEEFDFVRAAADPDREFVRLWTVKESISKALGHGLFMDYRDIILSNPDATRATISTSEGKWAYRSHLINGNLGWMTVAWRAHHQ